MFYKKQQKETELLTSLIFPENKKQDLYLKKLVRNSDHHKLHTSQLCIMLALNRLLI